MKKFIFWILLIVLLVLIVELFSWVSILYLKKTENITYDPILNYDLSSEQKKEIKRLLNNNLKFIDFDPDLGWTIKPFGRSALYTANGQKIRSDKEYSNKPSKNILRIATFGDSFTFGEEVSDSETWQSQLESFDHRLEVLNFGVGGYGIDQAYLRYLKEGIHFDPHIVIIGFTAPMINRSVSIFNPFMTKKSTFPLSKPRFIIENKTLKLIPNPFKNIKEYTKLLNNNYDFTEIIKHDLYYQRLYFRSFWDIFGSVRLYKMIKQKKIEASIIKGKQGIDHIVNPDTEAFKVTAMIYEEFYKDVLNHGSIPVIAIFPDGGNILSKYKYKREQVEPFISFFNNNALDHINLMEAFIEINIDELGDYFAPDKHYSPKGNKICAENILDYLKAEGYFLMN